MSYSEAQPVRISSEPAQLQALEPVLEKVRAAVGDVPTLLTLAEDIGRTAPKPGEGNTAKLWELLASVTAVDVAAGRVLEPHLDALAILTQAGVPAGIENEHQGTLGSLRRGGPRNEARGQTHTQTAATSSTAPNRGARSPPNWMVP